MAFTRVNGTVSKIISHSTGNKIGTITPYFYYEQTYPSQTVCQLKFYAGVKCQYTGTGTSVTRHPYVWFASTNSSIDNKEGNKSITITKTAKDTTVISTFTVNVTRKTTAQTLGVAVNFEFEDGGGTTSAKTFTVSVLPSYTISYNANGGTGAPSQGKKYHGIAYTISSTKPTLTNYTFTNWQDKNTAKFYNSGVSYTDNSSLNLYAQWKENTYSVTYNNNGGNSGGAGPYTYGVVKSPSITLLDGSTFSKTGYNIIGWDTDPNGTSEPPPYSLGGTYSGKKNITLYARWAIGSYNLSFDKVRPHTPFGGDTKILPFEYPLLDFIGEKIPIDVDVEGSNYYYSYNIFNGWRNLTDNKKIESSTTMPGHNITIGPIFTPQKDTTHKSVAPNISKVTAIRAQYDGESISSDDTGEGCILTIEGNPIKLYRFSQNNNYDTGELITPEKVKVIVQIENDNPYEIETNNEFPITINIYNDSSADINKKILLESSYNISVTVKGLIEENGISYETSFSSTKSDLLTKAQFTIDISANGDRIGIFQPINDYDENNSTVYPKHIVELNGGFKIQSDENLKGEFIIAENLRPIDSNSTPEDGVYFSTTRTANPNSTVYFGIGKGGVNRGIYLRNKNGNIGATSDGGGWMIYASGMTNNRTNVNIPGNLLVSGFAGIIQMTAIPAGGPGSPTLAPADNTTIYEPIPGWLICNGASVSKNVYPELFNAIQYTYGGSGNNFNLPDLRGRFPLGSNSSYPLNDKKGSADAVVVSHTHSAASSGYLYMLTHGSLLGGDMGSQDGTGRHYPYQGKRDDNAYWGSQANTGAASSGVPGTGKNMPPYIGVNFIICTGHIA